MLKTSLSNLTTTIKRYPKTFAGIGILTAGGIVLYEKRNIKKFFAKLVATQDAEPNKKTKSPDYIYIKYHIYKESLRKQRQKEEQNKKWISVITNPVSKWWKTFKHSVAWRLLNIAQTGSQTERAKAVHQLSRIDHLKDWDFRHLAQICDARTAVSLARCGADQRWFLPVHMSGCIKNPKIVLSDLHGILSRMRPNSCINHFFVKYFPEQDAALDIDEFYTEDQRVTLSVQDTDLLKEIIAFLHHITKDLNEARKFVQDGGLLHLMELRKIFAYDNETLATLCKVLANISLLEDSVEHFFVAGWIGVLAAWQKCPDLRLQVISAKAMANLDHDDPNHFVYPPNVYPLYPRLRTLRKPKADIVFIHGLLGGVFITWRQKDRKPTELGLYGKNAFYTSETDDVFLVGEHRRVNSAKMRQQSVEVTEKPVEEEPLLPTATKKVKKRLQISDAATKELVESFQNEAELPADWEVVHPDVPLKANEGCKGEFSVPGDEWENKDFSEDYTNCWPMEWLPDDQPNTRILGIDYTSAVTEWSANFTKYCPCEKGQGHLDERAKSLLERISKADVGNNRPVVWIGHSMGGILTKLMLIKALEAENAQVQQVAKNTSGIVFLGVPHRGSPIAKWKQHMQVILSPSIEVKEMEEDAPNLLRLHERFMGCLETCFRSVKIVSIGEGVPTMLTTFKFPLRIVTEHSARINHGDFYLLQDDHLSLSKPIYRQSFLYQRLLQAIDESVNETTSEQSSEQNEQLIALQQMLPALLSHNKNSNKVDEAQTIPTPAPAPTPTPAPPNSITRNGKGIFSFLPQIDIKLLLQFIET